MEKKGNAKVFFCILISLLLIIFLIVFTAVGCGKRALVREKLKSTAESEQTQSESTQLTASTQTIRENTETEEEFTSEETASVQEEETTQVESAEETTGETLQQESVEQEDQEPVSIAINATISESGYIIGETLQGYSYFAVGDESNNEECRGYVSFDISELMGSTIYDSSIIATANMKYGTPFETYGSMIIKAIYWGPNPITLSVRDLDGIELANFYKQKDLTIDNDILKEDLQNVVNSGSERYQITLYFEINETDGDNEHDNINYYYDDVILNVTFIPPSDN